MERNMTFEEICCAALALTHEERAELVDRLFFSLDDEEQKAIDSAWTVELERRLKDLKEGRAKLIPGDEVMRSLREGN